MNKIIFVLLILLSGCSFQQHPPVNPDRINTKISDQQKILKVVQVEVEKKNHITMSLTAHYLKIQHGWAYIETTGGGDPGINAVLRKMNGKWILIKPMYPCYPICPSGMINCADGELICQNTLHQQFPQAPISIFPSPTSKARVFSP